jgi:hypothetical protein
VVLGAIVLLWNPLGKPPKAEPTGVQLWPVAELPKAMVADKPLSVRVGFPHGLTPTDDPCVFVYSGAVPDVLPKTYEIHFREPPAFPARPPIVEGRAGFIADDLRRGSGVPGYVVLRDAVLVK